MSLCLFLLLLLSLSMEQYASASTRLGLHVTSEELAIWSQRRVNGPYRIQGDVKTNSPGDWDRISRYTTTFFTNPTAHQWTGLNLNPVDVGGDGCVTGTTAQPNDDPGLAQYALNAAFYILVHPADSRAATIASQLRTFLLASATSARLNFANTALWCVQPLGDTPVFQMGGWMIRMIHTYDYLLAYDLAHSQTTLSAGDKTTINSWINGAGHFYKNMFVKRENVAFVNAPGGNFTLTGQSNSDCTFDGTVTPIIYHGGPTSTRFHDYWNNRNSHDITVAGLAGILTNDTALIADAKRQAIEVLTYITAADGTSFELSRAEPAANDPNLGWRYSMAALALMVEFADALARAGDTSLLDWSTTTTVNKGASNCVITTATTKSIQSIITTMLQYADHTILRYSNGFNGNSNYIIDADNALTGGNFVHYIWPVMANLYWKSTYIKNMYLLNGSGPYTPTYPPGDQVFFVPLWTGVSGGRPGLLFQVGNLENVVDPYGTGAAAPSCTISAPSTFPIYDTATTPMTTLAGTATAPGGFDTITWVNDRGGSGNASGTTNWTVGSIPLQPGTNVVTVTITDDAAQASTCQLRVRYQTAADGTSALRMHLPLDEGSLTLANDATANNHDGTLSGAYTWVAGTVGTGAVRIDDATGTITVTGLLTSPAAVTVEGRFKLSGIPFAGGEYLSLGDAVALRISSTELKGFYYNGTSWQNVTAAWTGDTTWHDIAFMVKAGEQTLYLDGVLKQYTTHALAPSYAGVGSNTIIGAHGNGSTAWSFAGTIDNVRVWTRYLSQVDLQAALAATPTPPVVTITAPTSAPTYNAPVSPLTTLAGTATDADGTVSSVAWTCTPGCGSGSATLALPNWTIPSITLVQGTSTITVLATDNVGQTAQDTLSVLFPTATPSVFRLIQ